MEELKCCTKCQKSQPISEFKPEPSRLNLKRLSKVCKTCTRQYFKDHYQKNKEAINQKTLAYQRANKDKRQGYKLKQRYRITPEQYLDLLNKQNGLCAICHTNNPVTKTKKTFCVDHDHKTGVIRGLLCDNCNKGIGNLKDSIANLLQAINYLKICAK